MSEIDTATVTRAVVRIESAGYEFQWYRPFVRGKPVTGVGSASIVEIPAALLKAVEVHEEKNKEKPIYLVTAYHVVCNSERIWTTFGAMSERFETLLVGACPDIDVALLRVENVSKEQQRQLAALAWGDSDALRANETVYSAGFPHGQTSVKMARGIISGREQGNIQFDATVNKGNSGGPLLDGKTTRLVGVVTSSERNAQAMNYATPIDQVFVRLDRLLRGGMDALPSFNLRTSLTTPALLKKLGCEQSGSYVRFVQKTTPLYTDAGLREGDVLLELRTEKDGWMRVGVDGDVSVRWWSVPVTLNTIQCRLRIGDKVAIRYWSTAEKRRVEKEVVLSMADAMIVREYDARYETPDYEVFGGAVVMQLAVNHISKNDRSERATNWVERFAYLKQQIQKRAEPLLVVTHVLPSSSLSATITTLGPGDVLTHVNGERVKTLAEYRKAIGAPRRGAREEGGENIGKEVEKEVEKGKRFIVWRTEDGMATAVEYKVALQEYDAWLAEERK